MAMARTDIHQQWIRSGGYPRHLLSQALIESLSNQMFDHGPMRGRTHCNHTKEGFLSLMAPSQQIYCKIFQNIPNSRPMQAEERQKRIENYLQQVEFAGLEELAKHVEASISTVRRDLSVLEGAGSLKRTHGGARILTPRSDEFTFSARDTHQLKEKEAIGKACAER